MGYVSIVALLVEVVWIAYGESHPWINYLFWPFYGLFILTIGILAVHARPSWSEEERTPTMNSIFAIAPYEWNGLWVFDDEARLLDKEPFVAGADTMIETAALALLGRKKDFVMLFSAVPFPGNQIVLEWQRHERKGDVYKSVTPGMMEGEECWLCPALRLYFTEEAPKFIYVQLKAK
jgi:hypothetical protein